MARQYDATRLAAQGQVRPRYGRIAASVCRLAALAGLAGMIGGCADAVSPRQAADNVVNYLNLRNSFLSPNETGRFDKSNPWGPVKPVRWPILSQLDVVEEPAGPWASAQEPTAADLVPEVKEHMLAPGDTISVEVYELLSPGTSSFQQRPINELGYVNLQQIGPILASGLTPTQLESKIGQVLIDKKILNNADPNVGPQVNVQVVDSRQRVFSLLGALGRPGSYTVPVSDFRLLDAIALAGDAPVQQGMDYLYVIRQTPYTPGSPAMPAATDASIPTLPVPATGTGVHTNPADILEGLDKPAAAPATDSGGAMPTTPATGPQGKAVPRYLGPVPTAVEMNVRQLGAVAAADQPADLQAALGAPPTASSAPASAPAVAADAATAPVAATDMATTMTATTAAATTDTASATTATATTDAAAAMTGAATAPVADHALLEHAAGGVATGPSTRYVFIDGRWVPIQVRPQGSATGPAVAGGGVAVPNTEDISSVVPAEKLVQQRVIRIPLDQLREGESKYNIVVRPGDIINIPPVDPGEFYMMGHVNRPGVYTLTGRKITLKMAVASAGNLDATAIPRRCELIRRVGTDQEIFVMVDLQKIFDGEQPDIFLKNYDIVNVGTDMIAPFLLILRNAYRASYGFGFVYDRNLYAPGAQNNTSGVNNQ